MARPAARQPAPSVTRVRSRTVEKVDSIGFVVLRWIQCSAGKVEEGQQGLHVVDDLGHRLPAAVVDVGLLHPLPHGGLGQVEVTSHAGGGVALPAHQLDDLGLELLGEGPTWALGLPIVSMMDIPSRAAPLIVDVRQTGSGPAALAAFTAELAPAPRILPTPDTRSLAHPSAFNGAVTA
jgi:hypothetical protein